MQSRRTLHRLLLLLLAGALLLAACGGEEEEPPAQQEAAAPSLQQTEAAQTSPSGNQPQPPAPPLGKADTWLVMLYQDADDETLEQDIFIDLNEAEIVGSSQQVTIVAQLDRMEGGFDGGDDASGSVRYRILQDDDLENIASEPLQDLGEVNMSDPQTLVDFAVWAIHSYPAEKYALILSDHGMGWLGGWSDSDSEGEAMSMEQIDAALAEIIAATGIGQFELVGFDACLMAQVESLSAIAPHARYAVASEEVEPALGWAYAAFLGDLTVNPAMSGADLAHRIVETYVEQDFRITDDDARRVFVAENFDYAGEMSRREVADEMSRDVTLTAVELAQMGTLNAALNDFAVALASAKPKRVAAARAYAQSYEDVFGKDDEPSYFDLGHFASLAAAEESGDARVQQTAQALLKAIKNAVLAEKHGAERDASTGFSIYFPNSALYRQTYMGKMGDYPSGVSRFAAASLWDDFLTAFYTGAELDSTTADLSVLQPAFPVQQLADLAQSSKPQADAQVASPAAGSIQVAPLEISDDAISSEGKVTIRTTVSGENVAYLYLYTVYYSEEDDSYLTADIDFIAADTVKTVGGVTYPAWDEAGNIPIEIDWEPTVYFLSDGNEAHDQFALFEPEVYGSTAEEDVYTVYGLFTAKGSRKTREALMKFDGNGKMRSLWAFSGNELAGAPRQVTPKAGDTFTIWEEWLEQDPQTEEWVYNYYEGGTMTFGKKPLTMQSYYAFPGKYTIGIIAVDFDGNRVGEYAEVEVTE